MSMINPVANNLAQPYNANEQMSRQDLSPNVRTAQEASVTYAPNAAEWIMSNPVNEAKQKQQIQDQPNKEGPKTECQTCKRRRYQDGSNDPGVSFKFPQHLSPESAGAAVLAHEQEHVNHNRAEAFRQNKEIVYQMVAIHTDICPECGRVYVSGGTTTSVTRDDVDQENGQQAFAIPGENLDIHA